MRRAMTERGFTLVELMVSLVLSSMTVAGIYGVYTIQQRSYKVQEQVTEMQQRLRAAVDFMSRDIRMAGYDPENVCRITDSQKLLAIGQDSFSFQYCEKNGTAWETNEISYSLDTGQLRRQLKKKISGGSSTSSSQTLAEGIDGIEFRYFQGDGATTATIAKDVRVVQMSILIHATAPDRNYTDKIKHLPASGSGNASWSGRFATNPANDNFHRRLLITSIKIRNVGL